jgi:hypothetical protein
VAHYPKTWVSRLALAIPFVFVAMTAITGTLWSGVEWVAGELAIYALPCWLLGRGWIELDDAGLRRRAWTGRIRELRWDDITRFEYGANPRGRGQGAMAHLVAAAAEKKLGKGVRIAYVLSAYGRDGRPIRITSAYRKADEAIAAVLARISPRIVDAARARLRAGNTVEIGPMRLTATELTWTSKEALAIADVEKADLLVAGGKTLFRVLKRRKAWPYATIDAARFPTPVAIELLRELGIEVDVPAWFAP